MASLTNRTATLILAEILRFSVQMLSPILLVRILDVNAFGKYREFLVYSSLVLSFIGFSIKYNLLYFIAKDRVNEKKYLTNTVFLLFLFSVVGVGLVTVFRQQFIGLTTYDFFYLLLIYVLIFQNVDIIDTYWLSKKRTDYVFYWSVFNAIFRIMMLISVAYFTKNVVTIIYLLIALEFTKSAFTIIYLLKNKLLRLRIDFNLLSSQLTYIVPLGIASIIFKFNSEISKVVITSYLGAGMLAIYAIGSQNLPILHIIRASVSNVIFPEMASKSGTHPNEALLLWNRSTMLYLYLVIPLFFILFIHAEIFVVTLYTEQYISAVPLFRIYLLLTIRQCFEMGIPLRAINKNNYFVFGNVLSLGLNVMLIYILYRTIGYLGPALAYVFSDLFLAIFLGYKIVYNYNISLKKLFFWKKMFFILLIGFVLTPILMANIFIQGNALFVSIILSGLYFSVYLMVMRKMNIFEINQLNLKVFNLIKLKVS